MSRALKQKKVGLILAGGRSQRLFPLNYPKSLLKIRGQTLLDQAMVKLKGFEIRIVTTLWGAREIRKAYQGKELPKFIIEPESRNTGPAIGFAIKKIKKLSPKFIAIVSADHFSVSNLKGYSKLFHRMEAQCQLHPKDLVIVGSKARPRNSSEGSSFGWIIPTSKSNPSRVREFIEKPEKHVLRRLRRQSGLINSGIFCGSFEAFEQAYADHFPMAVEGSVKKYAKLPELSFDIAILEKYSAVRVIRSSLDWSDLGTWTVLMRFLPPLSISGDSKSNYFWQSPYEAQIESCILGLENICILKSGKRLLIAHKNAFSNIRSLASRMEKKN